MLLDEFFARLDGYTDAVPLDFLDAQVRALELDLASLEPHALFNDHGYRRNLLRNGDAYHALVLCWRNGQRSPIHDHRGSSCVVRVMRGIALETTFERTRAGHLFSTGSRKLQAGLVCSSRDTDIHQISNIEPDGEDLVTLHIYSPPLMLMGTYSLMHQRIGEFNDPVYDFTEGGGI